jgi:hypothetical protein
VHFDSYPVIKFLSDRNGDILSRVTPGNLGNKPVAASTCGPRRLAKKLDRENQNYSCRLRGLFIVK